MLVRHGGEHGGRRQERENEESLGRHGCLLLLNFCPCRDGLGAYLYREARRGSISMGAGKRTSREETKRASVRAHARHFVPIRQARRRPLPCGVVRSAPPAWPAPTPSRSSSRLHLNTTPLGTTDAALPWARLDSICRHPPASHLIQIEVWPTRPVVFPRQRCCKAVQCMHMRTHGRTQLTDSLTLVASRRVDDGSFSRRTRMALNYSLISRSIRET